jgi:hypothetical protein
MGEILLHYLANSRQALVSRKFSFPLYPEGALLAAENVSVLQAAAQEWVRTVFGKLPEQDELLSCPVALADRAVFLQQKEVEGVSVDLKRCDDPYVRILAKNARRLKDYPELERQQILLINQFEAILVVGLRCYPVFAAGVDDPVHPNCDLVASVWVYPSVSETQFWQFYRDNVPGEHRETAIVSFPLIQLEKAHQAVLTRCQDRRAPNLHLALRTALQHTCPTPLRGCQCLFYAACPGCHQNAMHLLQDLLKYQLAGGLCPACQGKTYGWLREKGWEH